jgi:chemotaxis protein CheD
MAWNRESVAGGPEPRELFLNPGDFAFGDEHTRIRTILGSCVAVTFWHPELKMGAMCHYMLPSRLPEPGSTANGRYGNEVLQIITERFQVQSLKPSHFQVKIFGGSNMSPRLTHPEAQSIGVKNLEIGVKILTDKGFQILSADVGHCQHRTIIFDVRNGVVWVRRGPSRCEMKCVFKPEEGCPHLQGAFNRDGSTLRQQAGPA